MSIENNIIELGKRAKSASLNMKVCSSDQKNLALTKLTKNLDKNRNKILEANKIDLEMSFQSRFGPQEWLKPYMQEKMEEMKNHFMYKWFKADPSTRELIFWQVCPPVNPASAEGTED